MIITAKFDSRCPKCDSFIHAGTKVEWTKGAKATHVTCPGTSAKAPKSSPKSVPKPAARLAGVVEAPYTRHVTRPPCKRVELRDATGEVLLAEPVKHGSWAALREGAEGAPVVDGDAFVVVSQGARYESAEDNEDMGDMMGAKWHVTYLMRRATDEEAAPVRATMEVVRAAKARAAEIIEAKREIERVCKDTGWWTGDHEAKRPAGREVDIDPGVHGSGKKIAVISEDGLGIAVWCGGYYDDYRESLYVSRDPRAVELFLMLAGKVD